MGIVANPNNNDTYRIGLMGTYDKDNKESYQVLYQIFSAVFGSVQKR